MNFNSVQFLIFFPIVVALYYLIPRKLKCVWLLVASYYFYMCWNIKYALLIAVSTLITYGAGLLLNGTANRRKRKLIVALSLVANLGILVFFKYFGFILTNINHITGLFGMEAVSNPFDFLLPVGISFYTFQALGYTIDVYRGEIAAEKNIVKYALFVSFFPQLVAGPIERSRNLLSQINRVSLKKEFDYKKFVTGFSMMVWGLFEKVVIADRISIFVDGVFSSLQAVGTVETLLAAFGFAIQIYCDFGGYSAIAIGAANVMGFDLMENFNAPYLSSSISDFWHRWHISLSTWFRDYLYIPLGGNRCSKIRKYFNIMVTFIVSGLWHGAAWTYVLWGMIHGAYQVIGDALMPLRKKVTKALKVDTDTFSYNFGRIIITFILTSLAWVPFRAASMGDVLLYFKDMFTRPNLWILFNEGMFAFGLTRQETTILTLATLLMIVVDLLKYFKNETLGAFLYRQNLWFRWLVLIVLIVACVVFGKYGIDFDSGQFIYFRF